jgi:hypothetical protein
MAAEIITKEDLQKFKSELLQELTSLLKGKEPGQKEWLRSEDVRQMLGISTGTLQNLRISKTLPFTKLNGTLYYSYQEVINVLNKNKGSK